MENEITAFSSTSLIYTLSSQNKMTQCRDSLMDLV